MPTSKLSIHVVEIPMHEKNDHTDRWYHTCLMLVDETTRPARILQQLHFNDIPDPNDPYTPVNERKSKIMPNLRLGSSLDQMKFIDVASSKILEGSGQEVMHRWNHALNYAFYIKYMDFYFEGDYKRDLIAVNCRTFINATIKAMGLMPREENFAQNAGREAENIPLLALFDEKASPLHSFQDIRRKNEGYIISLDQDWIPRERYVQPMLYPFLPMAAARMMLK